MSVENGAPEYEIIDTRKSIEFRGISFSTFQKSKVKNELLESFIHSKIEQACYWAAELICAGHLVDVWETIILFLSKHIHLGNPKLPIYISLRFEQFKTVQMNGNIDDELSLRNNGVIRKLFAEMIGVLCLSRKKHNFEPVYINKTDDFNMTSITNRLKAPNLDYAKGVLKNNDPTEFIIAINEFCYHISSHSKNVVSACYWVEWILEFEAVCKTKKELCFGEERDFVSVSEKYKHDIIWIIWGSIFSECEKRKSGITTKIVKSLLDIFCIKYSCGVKRKRRFLIYFAIALLTEPVDLGISMVTNKEQIDTIVKKIDLVYKDVNKNGTTTIMSKPEGVVGVEEVSIGVETDPKKIIFLKKQEFMVKTSSLFLPKISK
jgi:hypothetical protein